MKTVIVLGGGFAGSSVAKSLEKDFDVTLIDTKDYFEFTPGILRTIVEPTHIKKIQLMHTHYLKKARAIHAAVTDVEKKFVLVGEKKIKYDYLVICSGSYYEAPFKEQHIVNVTRAKNLRNCYETLHNASKILIIGGGLVGVELAGEICCKYKEKEITIVQEEEHLIQRNSPKAIQIAESFLQKRGVKLLFNEKIIGKKGSYWLTDKKNKIKADMVFLCTGIKPNYAFLKKNFTSHLTEKNQIKVNQYLQFVGENNIFAAGDITAVSEEKTAQNAQRQANTIVKNILAIENNKPLTQYISKKTPLVISLGKYNGIFASEKLTFGGLVPAMMKSFVEWREMLKKRM